MKASAAVRCGSAGALGALACWLTCCMPPLLIALGVGGSTTAGMASTGETSEAAGKLDQLLHLVHRFTPGLLIGSIVLIAGAFALRRRIAVIPALLAGGVLYVSVHAQSDPRVMYAGMVVGYGTWVGLYVWTRPTRTRSTRQQTPGAPLVSPSGGAAG